MATLQFEEHVSGGFKISSGSYAIMTESKDLGGLFPADAPFDPSLTNRLIQTDQGVTVKLKWTVTGGLAVLIAGKWSYKVIFEKMGGDEFPGEFSGTTPFVAALTNTYNVSVAVPANQLTEGVYRVIAIVNLEGPAPANVKAPVAAFADLGLIQVYQVS